MTGGRRALIAEVGYVAGGAAMLASIFLRWVARGPGSGLRGHALVDAVVALGRNVPSFSIGRLTIVWYLVPALGASSWIACGLTGPFSRVSRVIAGSAVVATLVVFVAFVRLVGLGHLGWGPKVACAGAVVLGIAAWVPTPEVQSLR